MALICATNILSIIKVVPVIHIPFHSFSEILFAINDEIQGWAISCLMSAL